MKGILHQATVDKIKIYGCDREEWIKAILEEIDADQLPVYYGGTKMDPDGNPKYLTKVGYCKQNIVDILLNYDFFLLAYFFDKYTLSMGKNISF